MQKRQYLKGFGNITYQETSFKNKQPCRLFATGIGRCPLGDKCGWLHTTNNAIDNSRIYNKTHNVECDYPKNACKDFTNGYCMFGSICDYPHHLYSAVESALSRKIPVSQSLITWKDRQDRGDFSVGLESWRLNPNVYAVARTIYKLVLHEIGISHSIVKLVADYVNIDNREPGCIRELIKNGAHITYGRGYECSRCKEFTVDIFYAVSDREIFRLSIFICKKCLSFGMDINECPRDYKGKTASKYKMNEYMKYHWEDHMPVAENIETAVSFAGLGKFNFYSIEVAISKGFIKCQ